MNLYQVIFLFVVGISFVFGVKDAHSIKKLLSDCTETVNEMNINSDIQMTEEDAKKLIKKMGKIGRISSIPHKSERNLEWKKHPHLKVLKTKMNNLAEVFKLSKDERDKMIKANDGMQKTIVKLSLLDPKNKKSPLKGKNIKKYLNQGKNTIQSEIKKGELKVKLIFRKLIPPSHNN